MSFPPLYIDPTRPAANNNPADDQPVMQSNFANINTYLQVDHTNPGITGAGLHNQVRFFSDNVPPTSPPYPTLFTNTVNGVGQLFYYSGSAAAVANQYYLNVSAGLVVESSTVLMGGIIMKWGVVSGNFPGVSNGTIVFRVQFPNNLFNVQLTGQRNNSATVNSIYVNGSSTFDKTGFGYTIVNESSGAFLKVYYVAIGN